MDNHLRVTTKTKICSYLFFILGILTTIFLTAFFSSSNYFNELSYGYFIPNAALSAITLFMLFKIYTTKNTSTLQKGDGNTFGIYFVHI